MAEQPPVDGRREWTRWSRAWASRIERTVDTVAPSAGPPEIDPTPDRHVWDTWPLRNRAGEIITVDGWQVLFSLTSRDDVVPADRHDIAELQYFVSRDGLNWQPGGPVFGADALGTRQWAGSALYDDGEIYCYYTAAGDQDTEELSYTQRLAVAHGGTVDATESGLDIEGPWTHEICLEPDGHYYETQDQSGPMTYTFRDPWVFDEPATGKTCLVFESNTPAAAADCGGDADQQAYNGCVGLAVSPSGGPLDWELRPPIFDSVCVLQEIERPHIVVRDGHYYLFVSCHVDTFAPGLAGYDGLYGFVADSLRGEYRPLNGSGLVVTNPATTPFQAYSWLVVDHGDECLVVSFCNYHDFEGQTLDGIAAMSDDKQRRRFGGTLAPTLRLAVDGDRTRIIGELNPWHVPTEDVDLPTADAAWHPPAEAVDPEPGRTQPESRRDEGPVW